MLLACPWKINLPKSTCPLSHNFSLFIQSWICQVNLLQVFCVFLWFQTSLYTSEPCRKRALKLSDRAKRKKWPEPPTCNRFIWRIRDCCNCQHPRNGILQNFCTLLKIWYSVLWKKAVKGLIGFFSLIHQTVLHLVQSSVTCPRLESLFEVWLMNFQTVIHHSIGDKKYRPDILVGMDSPFALLALITSRVSGRGHRIGAVCVCVCLSALSWLNRLTYVCVSQSITNKRAVQWGNAGGTWTLRHFHLR